MNREDVSRMAKEAGFSAYAGPGEVLSPWVEDTNLIEEITKLAQLVAAAEREACAQMCESRASSLAKDWQLTAANEARKCASILRNPPDAWLEKLDAIAAAPQPPEQERMKP